MQTLPVRVQLVIGLALVHMLHAAMGQRRWPMWASNRGAYANMEALA